MSSLSNPEQELEIRKVEEILLESMETVFQTSINPEITLELGIIGTLDTDKIAVTFDDGLVMVKVPHKNSAAGEEMLVFSQPTTAKISDLMVMGEGDVDFNADEHIDAIQEIVDQIFGAFSNSPADFIKGDRDYGLAEAAHGDTSIMGPVDDRWTSIEFVMNIGGEHTIFHLLSPEALSNYTEEKLDTPITEQPQTMAGMEAAAQAAAAQPQPASFQSFGPASVEGTKDLGEIEMLMDLRLPITIELGRTAMFIKDILKLSPGSIVELDKLSGDPVDLYVNDKKFAEGEVVVIDENFGVRITELIKPEERIKKLS
ncbi:MAG: flagellar motor switch protein FliN [FCB group bacterium]|nr:flagellar motor switch protein FliN [FCB group bacterium]